MLPKAVSISHACLAQLFFSTTVAIAFLRLPVGGRARSLLKMAAGRRCGLWRCSASVLTLAQVALGAGFRHRALGIVPHIIGAIVVTFVLLMVATFVLVQFPKHAGLTKAAWSLIGITSVQIILGVLAYVVRLNHWDAVTPTGVLVASTVAHVAFGALTMASSVALALEVFYHVRPRAAFHPGLPAVSQMNDYIQLTKPRITWLILMSTGCRLLFRS